MTILTNLTFKERAEILSLITGEWDALFDKFYPTTWKKRNVRIDTHIEIIKKLYDLNNYDDRLLLEHDMCIQYGNDCINKYHRTTHHFSPSQRKRLREKGFNL